MSLATLSKRVQTIDRSTSQVEPEPFDEAYFGHGPSPFTGSGLMDEAVLAQRQREQLVDVEDMERAMRMSGDDRSSESEAAHVAETILSAYPGAKLHITNMLNAFYGEGASTEPRSMWCINASLPAEGFSVWRSGERLKLVAADVLDAMNARPEHAEPVAAVA